MSAALKIDAVVGVVGAGTMGAGIAQVAAAAGHPVLLTDAAKGAVEKAVAGIGAALDRRIKSGKLDAEARDAILGRIAPAANLKALAGAALVIEAVAEDLTVKRKLLADLEKAVPVTTLLASNTSSLSITALAGALRHPGRVVGMHFFNPVPAMALVEVVSGLATAPEAAEQIAATAKAWGKTPIHVRSSTGFVVNRIARPFYGEALRLLKEGAADPATIDAVLRDGGGFAMGPFQVMDLVGIDVGLAVSRTFYEATYGEPRFRPSPIQEEMVAAGLLGRKSGRGFYDYAQDTVLPEPATAPHAPAPTRLRVEGEPGPAATLVELAEERGIEIERDSHGAGHLVLPGATLALSDGRPATLRAADEGLDNLVLFDLAGDYRLATRLAVAPADQAEDAALTAAVGLFEALGKAVSVVDDPPGLIVMRTVAMLANEAFEVVEGRVAAPEDVDTAMRLGVRYPRGPLAWAHEVGLARLVRCLDNLRVVTGEERYRAALLLRRKSIME